MSASCIQKEVRESAFLISFTSVSNVNILTVHARLFLIMCSLT